MFEYLTLWPDDDRVPSDRDGMLARLGGRQLYFVSRQLADDVPEIFDRHRGIITRHIIENASDSPVELMTHNIEAILARRPNSVRSKLDRILRALAEQASFQIRKLDLQTGPPKALRFDLARAAGLNDVREVNNLLRYAARQGLVEFQQTSSGSWVETTIPGLIRVEDQDLEPTDSLTGFVAMWFNPEMADAYSLGIAPAIEQAGFQPMRIDQREHNNKIDDEIISEIRRARFVVSDFSCGIDGARGGVYFEAGFALGLGKPVIFTVREADLSRVHFDTRQFNHIVWNEPSDLVENLRNRIRATIPLNSAHLAR